MDVQINYKNGVQFSAICRGHEILGDQPLDNGGQDGGMTPPEWFLAALGSCVGFYALKYLEARKFDPSQLSIRVTADKVTEPARLDHILIQINPGLELEARHLQGLVKAADACILHNTLTNPPIMTTEIINLSPT